MLNISDHGDIREIHLARPPVNAFDPALVGALTDALEQAETEARAVILCGRDGMFSAGLDVPTLLTLDREAMGDFWAAFHGLLETVACLSIPSVAAITGHSPAGGAVISLFCDYRVMTRGNYKIGLNETRVGLSLPPSIHQALVRLVGAHRAERLIVSGALISPEEAQAVGLVDALADDFDATLAEARAWCEAHLALPPGAMTTNRALLRESLTGLFDGVTEAYHQPFLDVWFSEETRSTLQALVASLKKK